MLRAEIVFFYSLVIRVPYMPTIPAAQATFINCNGVAPIRITR